MLKKTISFHDVDGNSISEDFHFNLNKAEVAELELGRRGGLSEYLKEIIAAEDGGKIIAALKEIVSMSVGRRSDDGRRFVKSEDITNDFMQSGAYSELFMELVSDPNAAADFIKGVLPPELSRQVEKTYTDEELLSMPQSEFDRVVGTDTRKMSREHLLIAMQRKNAA